MGNEWDLAHHALCVVTGAIMADNEELNEDIRYLEERIIDTGYYDGECDDLLKQIVAYLKSKRKGEYQESNAINGN
jgi:hypothetical protein